MIDDNWQEDYGKWNFHPGRFPNPKTMMDELHKMGFKVMLWVCPFVSPDCDVYRDLASKGAFLVNDLGQNQNNTMPTTDFRENEKPEIEELEQKIKEFREDELHHRDIGYENHADEYRFFNPLSLAIKTITKSAIAISKKI